MRTAAKAKKIEQKLLSALVRKPDQIFDIDGILVSAEDFRWRTSKCIYAAIADLASKSSKIDAIVLEDSVSSLFKTYYDRKSKSVREAIGKVFKARPAQDLPKYLRMLVDDAVKRRARRHLKDLYSSITEFTNHEELVAHFESKAAQFSSEQMRSSETMTASEMFDSWVQEKIEIAKTGRKIGISTGFEYYDEAIGGGLRRGGLEIIAARAKTGKTFMAENLAYNISCQDDAPRVLMMDTELDEESQMDRFVSIATGIPIAHLETGRFLRSSKLKKKVKRARKNIKKLPLDYVQIGGWSVKKQISFIRSWLARNVGKDDKGVYKPAVVILDYIKIMDLKDKGNMAEWEALGHQLTALKNLTGELKFNMIAFTQQNRTGIEEDHEGTVSGSDRLSWYCTSLSFLVKRRSEDLIADYENPDRDDNVEPSNLMLKVRLSRFGPGNADNEHIMLYSDIRNPRMPKSKKTAQMHEVCLQRYRPIRRGRRKKSGSDEAA
jgi:replicative DNA helicase